MNNNLGMNGMQTYPNPYYNMQNLLPGQQRQTDMYAPHMEVVRVNGRNGADAFRMGPNSSALLLDVSGLIVWAVTTDGAGYKTVVPYDIIPHKSQEQVAVKSLEDRIKRLEDMINDRHSEADERGIHEKNTGVEPD